MRVAVFGAGAIGGYLAAKLAAPGRVELSLVARGAQLQAIEANGIKLLEAGTETVTPVRAVSDPTVLGPQDFVLLTVKAHSVSPALDQIALLLGPDTAVVTMQNGVPWWYFFGAGGPHDGARIEAVDPGGRIWHTIDPRRVIGSVVYPAVEVEAPGVIRHIGGTRFSLGEPNGAKSARAAALAAELVAAGLQAPLRTDIRSELWVKLWGNLAFNPISALTDASLKDIVDDPGTRGVAVAMMMEAEAIGAALGVRFAVDLEQRIEGAGRVGAHKTSMLQDLERGRPIEIDALVTAVQELGRLTRVPTPTIDTILALARRLAIGRGCIQP
jgi:2-dehydropantoate 2-reductase